MAPAQESGRAFPEVTTARASGMPAGVAGGPAVPAGSADGPAATGVTAAPATGHPGADPATHPAAVLPPIESLTLDSNFAAFMRPGVDEALKRGALKRLFTDPHFNVMDGLDIYIDDYTKPDPVEPSIARELLARITFDSSAVAPAPTGDPVAARIVPAVPGPATGMADLSSDEGKPEREIASASADANDADVLRDPEALRRDAEALPRERDTPPTSR